MIHRADLAPCPHIHISTTSPVVSTAPFQPIEDATIAIHQQAETSPLSNKLWPGCPSSCRAAADNNILIIHSHQSPPTPPDSAWPRLLLPSCCPHESYPVPWVSRPSHRHASTPAPSPPRGRHWLRRKPRLSRNWVLSASVFPPALRSRITR